MYDWTPEPESILGTVIEGGASFSFTIAVSQILADPEDPQSEDGPLPENLDIVSTPSFPSNINVVIDGTEATISSNDPVGFFPIEIDYLYTRYEDSKTTITSWGDLPEEAEEIVSYRPGNTTTFTYDVQAIASDGNGENEETVNYSIVVENDFDIGKNILKQEVDKRK